MCSTVEGETLQPSRLAILPVCDVLLRCSIGKRWKVLHATSCGAWIRSSLRGCKPTRANHLQQGLAGWICASCAHSRYFQPRSRFHGPHLASRRDAPFSSSTSTTTWVSSRLPTRNAGSSMNFAIVQCRTFLRLVTVWLRRARRACFLLIRHLGIITGAITGGV